MSFGVRATRDTPLRFVLRERDVRHRVNAIVLSVYREHGIIPKASRDDNFNKTPLDTSAYKYVRRGDVVINKMKAWQGSLGVSDYEGIVSGDYMVCEVTDPDVDPRFLHHLLRSTYMRQEYAARSTGIRPAQWRLYWEDLAVIRVKLPDLRRQRAIASFLDKETFRIDAVIAKKRRLLSVLDDKRIALVTAAVTGQLKIGGADGRVPKRNRRAPVWPTVPLGHLVSINERTLPDTTDPDYSFRYLDISSVGRGEVVEQPKIMRFEDAPSRARRILRESDTIVSTVRTYLRAVLPIRADATDLIASTGFAVLSPGPDLDYRFLSWYAQASPFIEEVVARSVGVSYPAIAPSELARFRIPTPSLIEQRAIADYLDSKAACFNAVAERVDKQIVLLNEHRQALITAAVTGELEVPGVAA